MHPIGIALILGVALVAQGRGANANQDMRYTVKKVEALPTVRDAWHSAAWTAAKTLTIDRFHPLGSGHHPKTEARLLHDGASVAVIFRVEDRYVISRHTRFQDPTHKDSCVEFFVQPNPGGGYFNFEMNAGGTLLLWFVEDPRRIEGKFAKYTPVPAELAATIEVHASMPERVDPEIQEAATWTVSYRVPKALFEAFAGPIESLSGLQWRGNFYKCADASSHPHWGYWADIGDRLDFHQPDRFAPIVFE